MWEIAAIVVGTLAVMARMAWRANKKLPPGNLRVGNGMSGFYEARREVVLFGPLVQYCAVVGIATFAIGLSDVTTLIYVYGALGAVVTLLYARLLAGLFQRANKPD